MRNKYAGVCYRCSQTVKPGDGHFERFGSGWRVQHACCAILHRGKPDPAREALTLNRRLRVAEGTGRKAQRARKILRDLGVRP